MLCDKDICHKWEAIISSRTGNNKSGCPFCSSGNDRICIHYNLKVLFPEVVKEWHPNNPGKPEDYRPFSHEKVLWLCSEDLRHEWSASIDKRTMKGTSCPHCFAIRTNYRYSKMSIDWLKSVEITENIKIQYINPILGISEYHIPGIGKVDGYCHETNTVYEFHGNFWHGNPDIFDLEEINKVNGNTFGELYLKTIERIIR